MADKKQFMVTFLLKDEVVVEWPVLAPSQEEVEMEIMVKKKNWGMIRITDIKNRNLLLNFDHVIYARVSEVGSESEVNK